MNKFFLPLALLISNAIFAQHEAINEVVKYYNQAKNFNGAVLVATNGKIDYLNGIGISNRQSLTTINSKSKFKIASITKTFTAVLILQLYETGKLDLNETIGKYFPEYTGEAKNKVTIKQLLTYSSGIPNCESLSGFSIYQKPIISDSFIIKFCSGKMESEPGTKFNYDNGDFVILGKIIEKLTGKSFAKNLFDKILEPLEMVNTQMLKSTDIVTGLVQSYTFDDSTKTYAGDEPYYIENFFSAGAMYSTVEDLLKFDQAIFNYKLLNKKTVDLMLTPNPKLDNVGLGFWISQKYGSLNSKFAYRPGGILGASANWIHIIDSNRTIIVLSNTDGTNLFEMSQLLNSAAVGQKTNLPIVPNQENKKIDFQNVAGTWVIDLRPTPNNEAYLKDFIITPQKGKFFGGEFYGSAFANGQFNTDWDNLYFAFTTSNRENTYFHSGYINGNTISGNSYSAERKFISHWTGKKK